MLQACTNKRPSKSGQKAQGKPTQEDITQEKGETERLLLLLRLNFLKSLCPDAPAIGKLEQELFLLAYEIQGNIDKELAERELKAVECVKNNPKYFFSYAKRFSKLKAIT